MTLIYIYIYVYVYFPSPKTRCFKNVPFHRSILRDPPGWTVENHWFFWSDRGHRGEHSCGQCVEKKTRMGALYAVTISLTVECKRAKKFSRWSGEWTRNKRVILGGMIFSDWALIDYHREIEWFLFEFVKKQHWRETLTNQSRFFKHVARARVVLCSQCSDPINLMDSWLFAVYSNIQKMFNICHILRIMGSQN